MCIRDSLWIGKYLSGCTAPDESVLICRYRWRQPAAMGREIMQNVDLELRLVRKTCVVVCPTAKLPAEVKLDTSLGLESCSRWSEDLDCAQTCAPQIQFSSESLEDFVAIY